MLRKRPAQRRSRPVAQSRSRIATVKKKARSSGWKISSRRRPHRMVPTTSSSFAGSWLSNLLIWVTVVVGGGWLVWYMLIWVVIPTLIAPSENRTVAILPGQAGGSVVVAQLEPELKESKVFVLNGEETVILPGEYGEYRLSAVYPLLLIDEKDERYFRGVLNRILGVFLDSEIVVSGSLSSEKQELAEQLKTEFYQELLNSQQVPLDVLRIWYTVHYAQTIVKLDSVDSLVDKVRALNGGSFAARDECRVAILNSTTTPGLAGELSDIVEKNGGIVIRLGQYSTPLEKSKLVYDPSVAECTAAMGQIQTLSPVEFEVEESSNVQATFRAPVVAIIGKNFE